MRLFHAPLLALVALALVSAPSLRAETFRVPSPDENTIAIGGEVANRVLRYDAKRKELTAILTVNYSRYATQNSGPDHEDLFFTFRNVTLDPETKVLSVALPSGAEPVPIGVWKDGSLGGHAVLLYETTLLVTTRDRTSIKLAMDIDTERTVEKMKKKAEAAEAEPVTETLK